MDDYQLVLKLSTIVLGVLLLILGGVITARDVTRKLQWLALLAFAGVVGVAILLPLRSIPAWLGVGDLVFFTGWLAGGALIALVLSLAQSGRTLLALLGALVTVPLLVTLVWVFGVGSSTYGWGLYAVPPFLAGLLLARTLQTRQTGYTLYIGAWLFMMLTVVFPQYLADIDASQYSVSYALGNAAESGVNPLDQVLRLFQAEIALTVIHVAGSILLLVLPFVNRIGRLSLEKRNQTQQVRVSSVNS